MNTIRVVPMNLSDLISVHSVFQLLYGFPCGVLFLDFLTCSQAGVRSQKSTLNNLFTIKSIIQQRKHEGKETYVAFIDIKKAYDKVWSNTIFYLL